MKLKICPKCGNHNISVYEHDSNKFICNHCSFIGYEDQFYKYELELDKNMKLLGEIPYEIKHKHKDHIVKEAAESLLSDFLEKYNYEPAQIEKVFNENKEDKYNLLIIIRSDKLPHESTYVTYKEDLNAKVTVTCIKAQKLFDLNDEQLMQFVIPIISKYADDHHLTYKDGVKAMQEHIYGIIAGWILFYPMQKWNSLIYDFLEKNGDKYFISDTINKMCNELNIDKNQLIEIAGIKDEEIKEWNNTGTMPKRVQHILDILEENKKLREKALKFSTAFQLIDEAK